MQHIKPQKKISEISLGSTRPRVLDLRKKKIGHQSQSQTKTTNSADLKNALNFLQQISSSNQSNQDYSSTIQKTTTLSEEEKRWLLQKLQKTNKLNRQADKNSTLSKKLIPERPAKKKPRLAKNKKFRAPIMPTLKINTRNKLKTTLAVLTAFLLLISFIKISHLSSKIRSAYQKISHSKNIIRQNLISAQKLIHNNDFFAASQKFDQIQAQFQQIEEEINSTNRSLVKLISHIPIDSPILQGQKLITLGEDLTQFSHDLILIRESFNNCPLTNIINSSSSSPCLINSLAQSKLAIELAQKRSKRIENDLQKIDLKIIPSTYRPLITRLKSKLPQIKTLLSQSSQWSSIILTILGEKTPRNYLILFQNPAEIRASGGFIGSYALIKIFRGKIEELKIDDIYNPDGQLIEKIIPPKPLWQFNSSFRLTDANWFADFPTSAKIISDLFEKSGQATPDGIIAINPFLIQDLLKLTGPINLPNYQKTITAENFFIEIQKEIELGPDKIKNQPKKILNELGPILLQKLSDFWIKSNSSQKSQLANLLWNNFQQKNILIYLSQEKNSQNIFSQYNWSGEIKPYLQDYLMVVNNNFLGAKSDWVIKQKIDQEINIQPDGSVIETVKITRQHQGNNYPEPFFQQPNRDYLIILAPKGSQLISVDGFESQPPLNQPEKYSQFKTMPLINHFNQSFHRLNNLSQTDVFEENNLTGFGHWTHLQPGQTKIFTFQYKLPFKINRKYTLLIQKQSGSQSDFEGKITIPKNQKIIWFKPLQNIQINNQREINFQFNLNQDRTFGLILSP